MTESSKTDIYRNLHFILPNRTLNNSVNMVRSTGHDPKLIRPEYEDTFRLKPIDLHPCEPLALDTFLATFPSGVSPRGPRSCADTSCNCP